MYHFRSSQWVNSVMRRNNKNLHERLLSLAPTSTSLWSSVLISIPSVYGWRTSSLNNSLCTYSNDIKRFLRRSQARSNRNRIRAQSIMFCALPKSIFLKNLSSPRKQPFLLALSRWGRFARLFLVRRPQRRRARRNGCFRRIEFKSPVAIFLIA